MYAWKRGLKTTYYLRSRPATQISKTTVAQKDGSQKNDSDAVVCSLENPESCESCQ
jgi:ribonucleoside-diphosphate reductase alpha chain